MSIYIKINIKVTKNAIKHTVINRGFIFSTIPKIAQMAIIALLQTEIIANTLLSIFFSSTLAVYITVLYKNSICANGAFM